MSKDYLDQIARFAVELRWSDLPPEVVERAEWLLLDNLAVTLAASSEPRVRQASAMLRRRGSLGRSVFWVDGARGDAADAALVNATAACAHVLDEGHRRPWR